jgi:HD superfamily phosphodiesterase
MIKNKLINEVTNMNFVNTDLQKRNNKINMKIDINNSEFQSILDIISKSDLYKNEFFTSSFQHNIYHIQRVMLFSQIIAQNEGISEKNLTLLLWASALHDLGKTKDRKDFEHGKNSAEIAKEYLQNNIKGISKEDIQIIQIAIEYHTAQEKDKINIIELERLCQKYNVSMTNLERIKIISAILKDADALDRTRFDKENTLNIDSLRTNTARNEILIDFAKKVNQEFAHAILNSNYKYDNLIDNDAIKTLSTVRKRFLEENNGVSKKERLFPIRTVKKIFEDALVERTNYENQGEIQYRNCGSLYIGGTGDMVLCKDKSGMDYIFKPAYRKNTDIYQPYRAEVQVLASKLQEYISPQTAVKCEHCEIDGMKGTIQPKIELDEIKTKGISEYFLNNGKIDEKLIRQFMREYVVDFCLCNYDATFRNFVVDVNGNLRGVDKEQSFKYIRNEEEKNIDFFMENNPNEKYGAKPPIYGKIFKDIIDGNINISVLEELRHAITELNAISDEEYIKKIEPYINSLNIDLNQESLIYSNILLRKKNINNVFEVLKIKLYEKIKTNKNSEIEYKVIDNANTRVNECGEEQER